MLRIVDRMRDLRFAELMDVYIESNTANGTEKYPYSSPFEQLREAETDFYHYLSSVFFRQACSSYFVWEADGRYLSALRLEPYCDGFLLCGLETAPSARRQGCAYNLICATITHLAEQGSGTLYSHVSKKNTASLKVHERCGFYISRDYAVYSDGSVHHNSFTLVCDYKKSETN